MNCDLKTKKSDNPYKRGSIQKTPGEAENQGRLPSKVHDRQNKNPEDGQCESSNKVSVVPKSGNSRDSKHKKKQLHKCDQCAFSSTKSRELVTHRRFHESTNIHKCDQCPYITDKPRNLKRHMLRHTGQKPFQCEQCSYASIQKTHLKRHIRFHHP
ncbi:c2H2-type zinc-finger domain-containing protein [Ditylenchus destructor]|uniref:C2H2-type zinc-finger domain-containing protein n=1 Tax=Ditylenchus destructor TaxID=166010 RepID=A0AAD4QYL9_9BILA|nr:c2H2-type zinc-finger domain-containing protein [Ditylenchus destructor]